MKHLCLVFKMPSCVIPTCKNKSGTGNEKGISMHMFPYDEQIKDIWVRIVRRTRLEENWKPKKRSAICSAHFDEKDIYETKGIKRIQKGAIPTKNVATEIIQSRGDITSENECEASSTELVSAKPHRVLSTNTDGIDADITDINTFEERNLLYQIHRKIKYLHQYKRKVKMLKKRNNQLVRHNKKLKEKLKKYAEKGLER